MFGISAIDLSMENMIYETQCKEMDNKIVFEEISFSSYDPKKLLILKTVQLQKINLNCI